MDAGVRWARGVGAALVGAWIVAASGGCQDVTVRTAYGPGIRFYDFGETFDWHPRPLHSAEVGFTANPDVHRFVRETIERRFQGKGYRLESTESERVPDFWIDYALHWKARGGLRHSQWSETYEEGTIVINVVDPVTDGLIWRGYARARLAEDAPPSVRKKRIDRVVQRILERFPSQGEE